MIVKRQNFTISILSRKKNHWSRLDSFLQDQLAFTLSRLQCPGLTWQTGFNGKTSSAQRDNIWTDRAVQRSLSSKRVTRLNSVGRVLRDATEFGGKHASSLNRRGWLGCSWPLLDPFCQWVIPSHVHGQVLQRTLPNKRGSWWVCFEMWACCVCALFRTPISSVIIIYREASKQILAIPHKTVRVWLLAEFAFVTTFLSNSNRNKNGGAKGLA